jgi:small-conductance mechanosensitive channel
MFPLLDAVTAELVRTLTGRLFTEAQIRTVTSHAVGKYFADLFPEPKDERAARARVEEARDHISKASSIISELQAELSSQTKQLDEVLTEIEEKKQLAQRYATLAQTSQEQFAAFKAEMEAVLRQELVAQSEKGKGMRRLASAVLWSLTLILGAALGAYFKDILAWLLSLTT